MSASRRPRLSASRTTAIWQWVMALFLLRALLLPAGFMPDFSQGAGFQLAFCSAGGLSDGLTAWSGADQVQKAGRWGQHHHQGQCAFALAGAAPLAPTLPMFHARFAPYPAPVIVSSFPTHVGTPRGPPLGSRAPPALLS